MILLFPLITEALKTFQLLYQDQPIQERKAAGLLFYNVAKILIFPFLTADQKKALEELTNNPPNPPAPQKP